VPRPPLPRRVCCSSPVRGFRPIGRPACEVPVRRLGLDELEAIRLADREGLYQDAASERMGVSRQTFARILNRARATVAACLIEGAALVIESGPEVDLVPATERCPIHSGPRRRGRACRCRRSEEAKLAAGDS